MLSLSGRAFHRTKTFSAAMLTVRESTLVVVAMMIIFLLSGLQSRPLGNGLWLTSKLFQKEALLTSANHDQDGSKRAGRKPRAEPNSEPEGEPTKSQGHAKTETISEPESNLNSEPTAEDWPEPGPRWDEAYETWAWAWQLHVYLYATIFLAIGLYASYYVIANVYDGLQGKYLSVNLNILTAFFGYTRAFVMYLDPYHQGNIIHNTAVMRVIWSLSGPCLMASDCLMILALIETSKISIAPPKLQKASVNVTVISFHFILVITTDCVVADYVQAKAMLLFCQLFLATWGSVLGTANFILGYKLDKQLFSHKKPKEKEDKIYIYLIYASGAANYLLCGIIIYSAFGVFGVYSDVEFVEAWPWWTLQTLSRFSEILACVLIFTVSAKRTRVKRAVSMLEDGKDIQSIEGKRSSESKARRWGGCFKLKRATTTDVFGSVVSLYTALRELALGQRNIRHPNWLEANSMTQMTAGRECWTESSTSNTRTIIRETCTVEFHSIGKKINDKHKKLGGESPTREMFDKRRESMFTALHDEKQKISLRRISSEESASSTATGMFEEIETGVDKYHIKSGNKNGKLKKLSTCKVLPL